jgi:hypothetical protein
MESSKKNFAVNVSLRNNSTTRLSSRVDVVTSSPYDMLPSLDLKWPRV